MHRNRLLHTWLAVLAICALVAPSAGADDRDGQRHGDRTAGPSDSRTQARTPRNVPFQASRHERSRDLEAARHAPRGYDNHHDRYYPRAGYAVNRLSGSAWRTRHNRDDFYFDRGVWYRPFGGRYIVTRPAIGLFVPLLPRFYSTVWVSGYPYFYADDIYYRWEPQRRGYIVSEPPADAALSTHQVAEGELFMYPTNKQTAAQQATDRYECHRWAVDHSGFDPTQAQGGVAAAAADSKRSDYRRAMTACLEGRGYSVK